MEPWATGWTIGVRFLAEAGNFYFHHSVRNGSGAHPASYPMGTVSLSLEVKRPGREADHLPPSSAGVKNAWHYSSTPPIRLGAWSSTGRFITVLTRARHWSLSWSRCIQSTPFHLLSLRSILILSHHLLMSSEWPHPFKFTDQISVRSVSASFSLRDLSCNNHTEQQVKL
jgi:hypothetical protein